MTTHQNLSGQGSSGSRKGKGNSKDITKKTHLNHVNSSFNAQAFEIPAVTTNGMKNIEHYIEKSILEGKQWYRCKWQNCIYTTIRSDSIVRHMRKHTGERPYKCWFCSYATIQSSALKIHMRRHTGEKPYVCKYENCGKRFAVLNTLVVHERTHTGYKPYKCSFSNSCNYSSSDRCKLVNHMRKTHHVELDPNKVPSGQLNSAFSVPNGHSHGNASSSHSLALVGGTMSPSQILSSSLASSYGPFAVQNSNQLLHNNTLSSNLNQLKPSGTPSSPFPPINFLSVISSSENVQNASNTSYSTTTSGRKRKSKKQRNNEFFNQTIAAVKREENSIKKVMILVEKKPVNNRTSYICKWPNCRYESLRSDSIVRHIRSHTGERPYKCSYENCNYSTIQQSTLNKHLSRHIGNMFY